MTIRIWSAVFLAAVIGLSLAPSPADEPRSGVAEAGKPTSPTAPLGDKDYELFRMLAETVDQVERNYVEPIDRRELLKAAIEGILRKLDPHSAYIDSESLDEFREDVDSEFAGVGIQVSVQDGLLTVLSPLAGSPAYKAGVRSGDRIIRIEGKDARGVTIDQAVKLLKGPAGTKVAFTVLRADGSTEETFQVTRQVVAVETVIGVRRDEANDWVYWIDPEKRIAYVRIVAFSHETSADLKKALQRLTEGKMQALALDLRFNPGGLLSEAIETSDLFLPTGTIVSIKGRNTSEQSWKAKKTGTFEGFPVVVLVNEFSASASEIVAAALQDNGRATIVGMRTFGKGSVQNVIELDGGRSALKLTTAAYHRPNGKNIHRMPESTEEDDWGVRPNEGMKVVVSERQMRRLIDAQQRRETLFALAAPHAGPRPPEPLEAGPPRRDDELIRLDPQLRKGLQRLADELAGKE